MERPVAPVTVKGIRVIRMALPKPAFPKTQPWRRNIITPRIVNKVGMKTRAIVPIILDLSFSCSSVCS